MLGVSVEVLGVVGHWFPTYGHPDGPSDASWFRVDNGWGYRTEDNPAGTSNSPCFRLIEGWAYPTLGLPGTPATFQMIGSFAYPATGAPWFRIEERDT